MIEIIISLIATTTISFQTCNLDYGIGGAYNMDTKKIVVCKNDPDPNWVLFHELGHHYWFDYLNPSQQRKFESLRNNNKTRTEYGATHHREGFAEGFAYIYTQKLTKPEGELEERVFRNLLRNRLTEQERFIYNLLKG